MKRQTTIHKSHHREVDFLRGLVTKSPLEVGSNGQRQYSEEIKEAARNLLKHQISPRLLATATGLPERVLYSWRAKLVENPRVKDDKEHRPLVKILDVIPPAPSVFLKSFLKVDCSFRSFNCSIKFEF